MGTALEMELEEVIRKLLMETRFDGDKAWFQQLLESWNWHGPSGILI